MTYHWVVIRYQYIPSTKVVLPMEADKLMGQMGPVHWKR